MLVASYLKLQLPYRDWVKLKLQLHLAATLWKGVFTTFGPNHNAGWSAQCVALFWSGDFFVRRQIGAALSLCLQLFTINLLPSS
jgi:hypothetical protein